MSLILINVRKGGLTLGHTETSLWQEIEIARGENPNDPEYKYVASELSRLLKLIQERDSLIQEWNDLRGGIYQASKWDIDGSGETVINSVGLVMIILSVVLIIPIFLLPYFVHTVSKRGEIRKQIVALDQRIKSTIPLPIKDDVYEGIQNLAWGKMMIANGLLYKMSEYADLLELGRV